MADETTAFVFVRVGKLHLSKCHLRHSKDICGASCEEETRIPYEINPNSTSKSLFDRKELLTAPFCCVLLRQVISYRETCSVSRHRYHDDETREIE